MNISEFYNNKKKGTLIISSYRSGTHFIYDNLLSYLRFNSIAINTYNEVDDIKFLETNRYGVAIINAVSPKLELVMNQNLIKDWHVVRLTRVDKKYHWISYYVWKYFNTVRQQFDNTNLPHHGGTRDRYQHIPQVEFSLPEIETWLLEQLLINLFIADISLDYNELSSVTDTVFKWNPNDYNLTLEKLFTNHFQIGKYLEHYKVPMV